MGFGEYVGLLSFGIMTTGAIALRPSDLPLLVISAVVFSILIYKFTKYAHKEINQLNYGYLIMSFLGGILSSIGFVIFLKTQNMWLIFNGISWVMMGVILVKFSLEEIFQNERENKRLA